MDDLFWWMTPVIKVAAFICTCSNVLSSEPLMEVDHISSLPL